MPAAKLKVAPTPAQTAVQLAVVRGIAAHEKHLAAPSERTRRDSEAALAAGYALKPERSELRRPSCNTPTLARVFTWCSGRAGYTDEHGKPLRFWFENLRNVCIGHPEFLT